MSKKYNIKWKQSDGDQLSKAAKNYNAKITRLEKKYADDPKKLAALPEKVSVKQLKNLIATRDDFNRELNSLKRFTKDRGVEFVTIPGTDNNILITKYQKRDMEIRARAITIRRKNRAKEIENIEMQSAGEKLGYTRGQFGMGRADKNQLRPIKPFFRTMTQGDIHTRHKHFLRESQSDYFNKRDKELMDNFIEKGILSSFPEEDVQDIVDAIRNMDFAEFYNIFKSDPDMFEWASDLPDDADLEAYIEHLRATWVPKRRKK